MAVPRRKATSGDVHRVVIAGVRTLAKQAPAFHVARLAKEVRRDPRTVMHHLEMLEASGELVFLDQERRVVATQAGLERALRDAALEGWQALGMKSLEEIWDNEQDDVFNDL